VLDEVIVTKRGPKLCIPALLYAFHKAQVLSVSTLARVILLFENNLVNLKTSQILKSSNPQ